MPLIKNNKIEKLTIDFNTGRLIVQGLVQIIDNETNEIEAQRSKNITIQPRNNALATKVGILNMATKIWDYLGV